MSPIEYDANRLSRRITQATPRLAAKEGKRILEKHRAQIRASAFKHRNRKTRKLSESFFEDSIERFEEASYEDVLVHADLTTRNILIDPNSGKLAGVLDWGDSSVTDPALDFCGLFEINRHLGHETLVLYAETSQDFWDGLKFTGGCCRTFRSCTASLRDLIRLGIWEFAIFVEG